MVIPIDPSFERRTMALKDNGFNPGDFQWSERPARLQHKFLVLRKLGQGTYGKVQLALNKETNQEVAIKTIKKAKIESEEDMLRIRREIHIMTSIRHPHIIHINEVFETRQKIVIVMQYASGGELYDYLGCHHTLPEIEARRLFRQIASAIYYCHKNKICHRDLKLENILLDEKGNAQIADFGLSNIFDDRRRMNTFCGSPLYASPEIVKGTPYKGPEVDCWSLGVLLYTLIYGTMPFDGRNFKELVSQISEGRYEEPIIKSSASGLIRRLLTPEISRRATISDVCKDSWVNQGYNESLLIGAEKMTAEALLKTRKLGSPKFFSEKNNVKNGSKPSIFQAVTNIEKQKEEKHSSLTNGDCEILSSVNNQIAQKATLYEQILNYDVSFVINKLLVAVESALKSPKSETNSQSSTTSANEMATQVLKPWHKNGEHTLPTKVDSAYVIPIFEVTSIVPKSSEKKSKNLNKDISNQCLPNSILNGFAPQNSELHLQNNKLKTKKKELVNQTEPILPISKTNDYDAVSNFQKEFSNSNTPNKKGEIIQQSPDSDHPNKTTEQLLQVKKVNNQENILPRNPSVKAKRALENQLLGQKYFGSFFRSKNHSLTLARIFSMKYEKLVRTSFKLPDRKQKPPGKITIPATFDPSISQNELLQERKEILVFPTVSVSENKEKIEKKIDKIKKAALNMNHILRSNSANRLKIQKYLKSQAKKMQDLVCDEQRSINGSMEHINRYEGSVFSEAYFGKFEKGNLNAFNVKLHNKKINFVYSDGSGPENASIFDLMERDNSKFSGSGNLSEEDHSFGLFTLAKSKSDNQFPFHYANCSANSDNYSEFNSFENKRFGYLLSVPGTDGNAKLLRSASDSEGLSYYKNVARMEANPENQKASEMTIDVPQIKIDTTPLNTISKAYNEISRREAIFLKELMPHLNVSGKESSIEKCKEYLMSLKHSDYKNSVHRPTVSNASTNFQNTNRNAKLHVQQSSTYFLENGIQDDKTACENTFFRDEIINKTNRFSELTCADNECNMTDTKERGLRRRNTFSCDKDIMYTRMGNMRGKSADSCSDFDECIRAFQSEQELQLAHQKDETKFSSSPNLCSFHTSKASSLRFNDIKNVDGINKSGKAGLKNFFEDSQSSSFPSIAESSERSAFLKRILQGSNFDRLPSRRINRAKSISEDALLYNGSSDLHATQGEIKLSIQQGTGGNKEKTHFLSKFLNDLENREQHASTMNGDLSQRRYPRNAYVPGKRSKLEKRSKSFLQLLSLKRIQEAEKEIDRIERDSRMDAEEEESAGSLLEALKTHGYKGVISQRFQGPENSALDTYNLYNSTSPFLMRKFSPDISRFNSMYYDTLPQFSSPSYEIGEADMLNGLTLKPSFDMYSDFRPNSSKQFLYDWLSTTNQNMECPTSLKTDQDSFLETDVHNPIKESENGLYFGKENSKPLEDEASSSESFETPKDHYMNGTNENESFKTRNYGDYATLSHYMRSERNQLRRTSSTSEDEKEESVQDRIWRKSFYSRFNNSALSRKERSAFIDPHFSSESRAGFSGTFSPAPFKVTHRDGPESMKLNGYRDVQSKRIHTPKKYSPTNDVTFNDYGKMKTTSSKDFSDERTVNATLETKFDETEPEH